MSLIRDLEEHTLAEKPVGADAEWELAHAYYLDASREATRAHNRELGVGLADNAYPIEVAYLRRVITRLAVVYREPASRFLTEDGARLASDDPRQRLFDVVTRGMKLDLALRSIDRLRALFGLVIVRVYAGRRGPVLRVFPPYAVLRRALPEGDRLADDLEFALRVGGREPGSRVWEHWSRSGAAWRRAVVHDDGSTVQEPIELPYCPVLAIYDEEPLGRTWVSLRGSRLALQRAVNAKANDLWALVRGQAHADKIVFTNDPDNVPDVSGPGTVATLEREDRMEVVQPSPKIADSSAVLREAIKLGLVSEGIPSADLDDSKTILTGAALRVQERELVERRQEQVEYSLNVEQELWEAWRSLYNDHATTWASAPLDPALGLEVEIAEVGAQLDAPILQAFWHHEMTAGLASPIDWIMRRDDCTRAEAARVLERARAEIAAYELPTTEPPDLARPVGSPGGDREVDPEVNIPLDTAGGA